MNIFWIEDTLEGCARSMCNEHVVKMCLEYVQMLCNVHHRHETAIPRAQLYKPTHINHPCSRWVATCKENYMLLYVLWLNTCAEYTKRYGRKHKCQQVFESMLAAPPFAQPVNGKPTVPPAVIGGLTTGRYPRTWPEIVVAYRDYYNHKSATMEMHWREVTAPHWFRQEF